MTEFERDILRHLNGEDVPGLCWGAAMGVAISGLRAIGLVERVSWSGNVISYEITDAGRAALTETGQEEG